MVELCEIADIARKVHNLSNAQARYATDKVNRGIELLVTTHGMSRDDAWAARAC